MSIPLDQFRPTLEEAIQSARAGGPSARAESRYRYVDFREAVGWIAHGILGIPGVGPHDLLTFSQTKNVGEDAHVAIGREELAEHLLAAKLKEANEALWGVIAADELPQKPTEPDAFYALRRTVQISADKIKNLLIYVEEDTFLIDDVPFEWVLIEESFLTQNFQPFVAAGLMLTTDRAAITESAQVAHNEVPVSVVRGRPPKWDWEWFFLEVIVLANSPDGLPEKQAELETWTAERFFEKYGAEPAASLVRKKVGPIYQLMRSKSQ